MFNIAKKPPFILASSFFIFSFLWILLSDKVIRYFVSDANTYIFIEMCKSWFYVFIVSIIIYYSVKKVLKKEEKLVKEGEDIFNNSATPIALIDCSGNVLKLNNVWSELSGYSIDEVKSLNDLVSKLLKVDSSKFYSSIKVCLDDTVESIKMGIYSVYTKDSMPLLWNFDIAVLKREETRTVLIITAVDVTEIAEKEKLLVQQSKMATMGEMIESIAHQWRQPMSLISASSYVVEMHKDEIAELYYKKNNISFPSNVGNAIDNINLSVQNLSQTIDDFKNFFDPNKKVNTFIVGNAIKKTLKLVSSEFANSGIDIIQNIEDVEVYSYENELLQTLVNLARNSKDALMSNMKDEKKFIFINVYKKGKFAIIKIKDNGRGIPDNRIDKVFDAHYTTKKEIGGTGIGLYMSRRIIEGSMKGRIRVSNSNFTYDEVACKGAEFIIVLPIDAGLSA